MSSYETQPHKNTQSGLKAIEAHREELESLAGKDLPASEIANLLLEISGGER